MTDLWGDIEFNADDFCESKAIGILREQARLLGKKTSGVIKATFSKVEYKDTTSDIFAKAIRTFNPTNEEIIDADLEGKKDINSMYRFTEYKFEIFSSIYRFRAFVLNYRSVFPIELEVDEGVREELKLSPVVTIYNDEELKKIVNTILTSEKVRRILNKMYSMKDQNDKVEKKKRTDFRDENDSQGECLSDAATQESCTGLSSFNNSKGKSIRDVAGDISRKKLRDFD